MAADLHVVPDTDVSGRVGDLRGELAHHPVHRWASSRGDRTMVLGHVAFSHWAGAMLASTLGVRGPARQFEDTCRVLRRRAAGPCLTAFAGAVAHGAEPTTALLDAAGPQAARPLVELTARLVARGSRHARAGALLLGLPGCVCDEPEGTAGCGDWSGLRGHPAAEDAATAVLVAQLALLDDALETIRHRHMAAHPSMWQRRHHTPPRLRLLPAC